MHPLAPALKLWLNLQCQMINETTQAVLVEHVAGGRNHILAKWPEDLTATPTMVDAAKQVMAKQRTHLAPGAGELLLGQPVFVEERFWGAVVLRIAERDQAAVAAALKLLKWGMTWLQYLLFQQEKAPPPALLNLLSQTLKHHSLHEAAITTVNQLATQLHGDHLALGLYRAGHFDIQAVSFAANFDKRARALQLAAAAMAEAADQRVDVSYPTTQEGHQLILRSHEQLHRETGAGHIHTALLRRGNQVVGALTLQSKHSLAPTERAYLDQCLPLLAEVFHLRSLTEAGPWQNFKRAAATHLHRWWGPGHWVAKAVTATVIAFALLLLIPANYHIPGEAVLQSTEKRVVVANQNGYLARVNARPGEVVEQGAVLAQMDDEDLRLERRKLASQLQQFRQEYDNALANAQRVQAAIASAQVEQATAQLRLIEQQLERTHLKSPMKGIIVSDDISQSVGAPVKQGDVLFEIAAQDGYRVVLYVDERDVGRVQPEQPGKLVLTSTPGEVLQFEVVRITPVSEIREGRNYFRVEGDLSGGSELLRPGMTGSARIGAGRRALGWIWFHGLIDWLRLVLWL